MVTHTNILDISTTSIYINNDITIYCVQNDYPIDFPALFHKRFYLRWPANSKLQWDAYFMQLKHVAAITVTTIKFVH